MRGVKLRELEKRIVKCIDHVLLQLGKNIRYVIYWYLEKEFGIKKEDIPKRPKEFIRALETVFGSGAKVMERLMIDVMEEEFKLNLQVEDLEEAVQEVYRAAGRGHWSWAKHLYNLF